MAILGGGVCPDNPGHKLKNHWSTTLFLHRSEGFRPNDVFFPGGARERGSDTGDFRAAFLLFLSPACCSPDLPACFMYFAVAPCGTSSWNMQKKASLQYYFGDNQSGTHKGGDTPT